MRTKKDTKNPKLKTKLEWIMFLENLQMNTIQEGTGLSYPLLFDISEGRRTEESQFSKRSIRDLEKFLKRPANEFLGWKEEADSTKSADAPTEKSEKE